MCSAAAHTLQLTHSPKCNQHEKRDMLRHWTVIVFLRDLVYQVTHSIIAGQWRRQRNRHNWPTSPVQFVVFLDIAILTVVRMLHWKGLGPLFEGLCFCFRRESINQINDYQKLSLQIVWYWQWLWEARKAENIRSKTKQSKGIEKIIKSYNDKKITKAWIDKRINFETKSWITQTPKYNVKSKKCSEQQKHLSEVKPVCKNFLFFLGQQNHKQ